MQWPEGQEGRRGGRNGWSDFRLVHFKAMGSIERNVKWKWHELL
jgi:hypothetical protein